MLTRDELDQIFHPLPTLETERLVLEPVRSEHAEDLFPVYSDPALMAYCDDPPHRDVDATRAHIGGLLRRHEARTAITWVLFLKGAEGAVGQVSVHSISWSNRRGDLGFELSSEHWRRRIMTEAIRAVIDFCFSRLRFVKLSAQNTVDNVACHALLLGLGFREEGFLRSHGFWKGKAHDLRQYGLLADSGA